MGISVSLHEELKFAIIRKASEHRKREAAALGIPEQDVESLYLTEGNSESTLLADRNLMRQQEMDQMRHEMLRQQELIKIGENSWSISPSDLSHIKDSDLPSQSLFKSIGNFKRDHNEEQFGDSDEEEDDDEIGEMKLRQRNTCDEKE